MIAAHAPRPCLHLTQRTKVALCPSTPGGLTGDSHQSFISSERVWCCYRVGGPWLPQDAAPLLPQAGQTRPKGTGQPLGPRRLRQQMAEEMGEKRPKDEKRKVVLQRTGAEGSPPKSLRHPSAGPRRAQARFPAGPALAQHVLQEGMHLHRSGGRRVGLWGLCCPQTLLGPSEARGGGERSGHTAVQGEAPVHLSIQERELRFWLGPPWACPALRIPDAPASAPLVRPSAV